MSARTCVHDLMVRYNVNDNLKDLYHFKHTACAEGITAVLVASGFNDREFRGFARHGSSVGNTTALAKRTPAPLLDRRAAEQEACEVFKKDGEVDHVRQRLPPPIDRIRKFFNIDKHQKDELAAMGFHPKAVQSDITKAIYSGFRDLGCRTALWDMSA